MRPKPAHFSQLTCKASFNTAKLAAQARADTIHGGAKALVLAEKYDAKATKFANGDTGNSIVSEVYSQSSGKHSETLEGWECPECGNAVLGLENAFACCAPCQDEGEPYNSDMTE